MEFSGNTYLDVRGGGRLYLDDGGAYYRHRLTGGGWYRDHLRDAGAEALFLAAVIAAWIFEDRESPYHFINFGGGIYSIAETDLLVYLAAPLKGGPQ